jgi:hypothetical protein
MTTLNPRQPTPHGFVVWSRCARCGTERPESGLVFVGNAAGVCVDLKWCSAQQLATGLVTGIDSNGDAE